ncbi:MAG: hypothetical protein JRI55_39790, partial [Deltaproteobacteria bacterium]|nr:hypothetical protein [Deltaproteobacteria bacterium]
MPRPLDFEKRYRAAEARPFPQKNELYCRSMWDPEIRPVRKAFFGVAETRDRAGRRIEDFALRNT